MTDIMEVVLFIVMLLVFSGLSYLLIKWLSDGDTFK